MAHDQKLSFDSNHNGLVMSAGRVPNPMHNILQQNNISNNLDMQN